MADVWDTPVRVATTMRRVSAVTSVAPRSTFGVSQARDEQERQ